MKKLNLLKMSLAAISLFAIFACGNTAEENKANNEVKQEKVIKQEVSNVKVGIQKGNKIPNIVLTDLLGVKTNFYDIEEEVVMLNFWATWCPPCRYEMPSMEEVHNKYKDSSFKIVAVSVDSKPSVEVAKFINENKYTFPVYYDTGRKLGNQFLVRSIPTTYIVKNGIIVDKITGAFDWTKHDIDGLLKGE